MQLRDRRIIVTGGASGIGAAAVRAYAREGARVVCLDVNDEAGARVAAEATGGRAVYRHCDVARRDAVFAAFDEAVATLGGLDVLTHVAGVERGTPAEDIDDAEWDLVFAVNVKGTLYTNQAAFRHMRAAGGRIINFGSGAGIRGQRGSAHYAAAKGAVMAWTRTVAQEWAPHGISVNSIVPAMWTPMYDAHRARMSPEQLAVHDLTMQHVIPLGGRLGDPDRDMAPVLVFLAGDGARFITGQAIAVDGGMIMLGSPRVRFGIQTPQYATDLPALAGLWQAAERLGFRSAWLMDHLYPILAPPTAPILEAWTTLTALAVATRRLRVGVLVTANTFRHPAVLARMAATLDHVAGGRLEVGLGAAWCREEHEEQGIPFPSLGERLTRLDEACTVLRRLWTEPAVTFAGRHYQLTNARCAPKPAQARLPLLVAGQGERRALRIVARHADRWNASGAADTLAAKAAALRAHAAEVGRPVAAIALTVRNDFQLTADPAAARATRERFAAFTQTTADEARQRLFVGNRREVTDLIGGFATAGFDECILALGPPYDSATAEMLAEFAAEIAPVFGGP